MQTEMGPLSISNYCRFPEAAEDLCDGVLSEPSRTPLLSLSPLIPLPTYPSPSNPFPLILLPSFLSPLPNAPIISSLSFHILPQSSLSQFILLPTRLSPKSSLSPLSLSLVCTLSSRPSHPFSHLIFLLSPPPLPSPCLSLSLISSFILRPCYCTALFQIYQMATFVL